MILNTFTRRMARFSRSETGSMTIFALVMFVLMVLMGGMAVDIMRFENTRVTLQQTLDRSTLAAASMSQALDPADVVTDYMVKAGLGAQLDQVRVTQSAVSRSVVAKGKVDLQTYFMQMMGIRTLPARAVAAAEQGTSNLEISLVLDVSGSMNGQKIADLRSAATEFVTTMLQNDPFNRVSIAIVPYNAQVNLGADLRAKFQVINANHAANIDCLELPDAAYDTPGVPPNMDLSMVAYADLYNSTSMADAAVSPTASTALPNFSRSYCRPNQENIVRLPSQDLNTIVARINALTAGGNTSITLGMKWGMTLLDPSMNRTFQELSADGLLAGNLNDRPYAYADTNAQKVVILMTDGEHVAHDRITDPYKAGPSPIYLSPNGFYSVYKPTVAGPNNFYVPHLDDGSSAAAGWQSEPFNGGGPAVQQNWEQVWAKLRVSYVAWQFNGRALGTNSAGRTAAYNNWYDAMIDPWKSRDQMDTMLQTTCNQARNEDVMVFGIAFQAPAAGAEQILNCATNPGYYFAASNGDAIRTAFRQIATNLTQLRLTQ